MYCLFRLISRVFNIDIENKNKTRLNYFKQSWTARHRRLTTTADESEFRIILR